MNAGDLYTTPNNQHRLVLGQTANGDVAFATRGGNTQHDYNQCQVQPTATFGSQATLAHAVDAAELTRVQAKFAPYITANGIR
ncbi:hypothetical protein D3C86_1626340 [compost metagenome]